jgi:hypothetical protein
MGDPVGIALVGITTASWSAMPSRRSASARSITPPSEVIRPPSKVALTFLRAIAGKPKGSRVSIGVRRSSITALSRLEESCRGLLGVPMLVFRQLFDPQSSTYTYLLGDKGGGKAVLIDPVFEQVRRGAALIDELGLSLVATLETHVHADHVTGAWLFKRRMGSQIMLAAGSGAEGADRYLVQDDVVAFGGRRLLVRTTPGHTNGCLTYVLDDSSMAFTGDCLLIRGSGRTDF